MSGFRTADSRVVYDGRVRVRVDDVVAPEGDVHQREVVESMDSVVVVPLLPDGRVVLVRQFRQPAGKALLELPAGTLDVAGEQVLAAADRELAEEVGLGGGTRRVLGHHWVSPGWSTERTTIVLAEQLEPTSAPDGFEARAEEAAMDVVQLAFDDALDAVVDGRVVDATTALGLLLAARVRGS